MTNIHETNYIFYTVQYHIDSLKTDLRPCVPIELKQKTTYLSIWCNCGPQTKLYIRAEDIKYEDDKDGGVCVVIKLDDFIDMYKKTIYFDAFMLYDFYHFNIEFWTEKALEK